MTQISNKKILVVGDVIIDTYHECEIIGLASESPTLSVSVHETKRYAGGSALVAKHMSRLGADVVLMFPTDGKNDITQFLLYNELSSNQVGTVNCNQIYQPSFKQPEKIRYFSGKNQLFQISDLDPTPSDLVFEKAVLSEILSEPTRLTVVCDNRHAVLTPSLVRAINESGCRYFLDVQVSKRNDGNLNYHWYEKASLVFANWREGYLIADHFDGNEPWPVVLKEGEHGSSVNGVNYPGRPVQAVDTIGAGDAYLAAYSVTEDHDFANAWAALSVTVLGTRVPTLDEALARTDIFRPNELEFLRNLLEAANAKTTA